MIRAREATSAGRTPAQFVAVVALGLVLLGAAFVVQLIAELVAPPGITGHHDLLAFWAAGRLILDGRPSELYDATALTAIQRAVIPDPIGMNGYMPYINPPVAAVLFAPLAALSETTARIIWAVLNALLALVAGAWISRDLGGRDRLLATIAVATSFPMVYAIAEGQWSIVILAAGLVALWAARRGSWLLVGVALAAFWLKPQFIVLPLLAVALARRWRAVAGAVGVGALVAAAGLPFSGLASYGTYAGYLVDVVTSHFSGAGSISAAVWQGDLASTEGLNGLLVGWLGQANVTTVNVLWAVLVAGLVVVYALAAWRVRPGLDDARSRVMLAAGVGVMVLVNPNQFVQDCVLLYLALDVLAPFPVNRRFTGIIAAVGIVDLTFVDQQFVALHALPIVVAIGVLWACRRALTNSLALDPEVGMIREGRINDGRNPGRKA